MPSFVSQHQHQIQGSLSGFDRLRFVGSLLRLSYVDGLAGFLAGTGVLLKEFGDSMLGLEFCKYDNYTAYKIPDRPFGDQNARRDLGASRDSGSRHDVVVTTTECRSLRKCRKTRGSA